jgi:hypothetical protein
LSYFSWAFKNPFQAFNHRSRKIDCLFLLSTYRMGYQAKGSKRCCNSCREVRRNPSLRLFYLQEENPTNSIAYQDTDRVSEHALTIPFHYSLLVVSSALPARSRQSRALRCMCPHRWVKFVNISSVHHPKLTANHKSSVYIISSAQGIETYQHKQVPATASPSA